MARRVKVRDRLAKNMGCVLATFKFESIGELARALERAVEVLRVEDFPGEGALSSGMDFLAAVESLTRQA